MVWWSVYVVAFQGDPSAGDTAGRDPLGLVAPARSRRGRHRHLAQALGSSVAGTAARRSGSEGTDSDQR